MYVVAHGWACRLRAAVCCDDSARRRPALEILGCEYAMLRLCLSERDGIPVSLAWQAAESSF
eukprot:2878103-Prymnesium_polylepis.1